MSDLRGGSIYDIPLQARPPTAAGNPLGTIVPTMLQFAETQNALNQNRLFQQTFAARQLAGQIISTAPDMDTALQSLYKNPVTAPFATETANSLRQLDLTMNQIQSQKLQQTGEVQKQYNSAMDMVFHGLAGIYNNPTQQQWQAAMAPALLGTSGSVTPRVQAAIEAIRTGLMDNLPSDPTQALSAVRQRIGGFMLEGNLTPETMRAVTGTLAPQVVPGAGPGGTIGVLGGPAVPGIGGGGGSMAAGGNAGGTGGMVGGGTTLPGGQPAIGGPSGAPAPGAGFGLTPGQKALQEKLAGVGGQVAQDISDSNAAIPGAIKRLDIMQEAVGKAGFQAGGLANWRARVGQLMQGLMNAGAGFITPEMVNGVANSNLPATQVFQQQIRPLVINQLKQAAAGTGRVMKSEVDAFLQMADPDTDPGAIRSLLNQSRYNIAVDYDKGQKFGQFVNAGGNPAGYEAWYAQHFDPRKLPKTTSGGLNLSPMPEGQLKQPLDLKKLFTPPQ